MLKSTNLKICKTEQKVSIKASTKYDPTVHAKLFWSVYVDLRKMLNNLVLKQQNTQSFMCGGRVLWNYCPLEVPYPKLNIQK